MSSMLRVLRAERLRAVGRLLRPSEPAGGRVKLLTRYIRLDVAIVFSVLVCWLTIPAGLCVHLALIRFTSSEVLRLSAV